MKLLSLLLFISLPAKALEFSFEQDRSLPLVHINIVLKGGASTDPDQKNGVTNVMMKLLLRGTKTKTKQQIDLLLDQLGASIDVETRAEYTVMRGRVLSENVDRFLVLLQEVLTQPSFRVLELEKLKKEEISEVLDDLGSDQKLARLRFDQYFFRGHPYSKSNNGKVKDLQNLNQTDVVSQYRKLLDQSRMLVIAAGDTDEENFGRFNKEMENKLSASFPIAPVPEFKNIPTKLKVMIFDKPDRTQTQIIIGQKGLKLPSKNLDAIHLANFSFGGGTFLSKLMVELRVKRGWTYGASSGLKLGSQPHSWRVSFVPKNSDTAAAIKETLKLIRNLRESGLTEKEFNETKTALVNKSGFDYNTPAKRMENSLIEKIFNLPNHYFRDSADRIKDLTLEDVNSALKSFITPDQMMIGIVGTASTIKASIAKELNIPESEIEVVDYLL